MKTIRDSEGDVLVEIYKPYKSPFEGEEIMITIFLVNFGYSLDEQYWMLSDAVAKAKEVGFECAFMRDGITIAAWHPISGMSHRR